jgi:hypothetical protein
MRPKYTGYAIITTGRCRVLNKSNTRENAGGYRAVGEYRYLKYSMSVERVLSKRGRVLR